MRHLRAIRTVLITAALLAAPAWAKGVYSAGQWDQETLARFAAMPIQDGGRIKPLDTYASFKLLRINGKRALDVEELGTYEKLKRRFTREDIPSLTPMEWFLDALFYPEIAKNYRCFWVEDTEAVTPLGAPARDKRYGRYSYNELLPVRDRLFEMARQYHAIEAKDRDAKQNQIVNLNNNLHEFEFLIHFLDFARTTYPTQGSVLLEKIYDGKKEVKASEVLAKGPELRKIIQAVIMMREQPQELDIDAQRVAAEEQAIIRFYESVADEIVYTQFLAMIPPSDPQKKEYLTPAGLLNIVLETGQSVEAEAKHVAMLEDLAAKADNKLAFADAAAEYESLLVGLAKMRGEYSKIPLEVSFYRAKYFFYAQWLFVFSFLLVALSWLRVQGRVMNKVTWAAVLLPWALLVIGIVYRCIIRGRPPVSTLYETVLFITAVAVLSALFMEYVNRQRIAISLASILGVLGMFIANKYEASNAQDTMPALEAVLDTNFWLATHVTIINVGYAAGLLAAAIAHVYILGKLFKIRRDDKTFYRNISRMVYGTVCFALLFSFVGTVLGGIWANYSWGRFWGWDPKENGALMIVLCNLAILHARLGGYIRDLGVAMASIAGGCIVAFSWWHVNLLGVGLHSYGFTSGILGALLVFYATQSVMLLAGLAVFLREHAAKETRERAAAPAGAHPVPK